MARWVRPTWGMAVASSGRLKIVWPLAEEETSRAIGSMGAGTLKGASRLVPLPQLDARRSTEIPSQSVCRRTIRIRDHLISFGQVLGAAQIGGLALAPADPPDENRQDAKGADDNQGPAIAGWKHGQLLRFDGLLDLVELPQRITADGACGARTTQLVNSPLRPPRSSPL